MKHTSILLFGLFASIFTSATAAPRDRAQARVIAQEKAAALGITMASEPRRAASTSAEDTTSDFYIFNNGNEKGWTIVAGDDRTDEIIGYSDNGSLDETNLPAPVEQMLAYYSSYVKNLGDTPVAKSQRRAAASGTAAMGPYLATRWDQYKPYNNLTPTSSGSHCATGCVATAFGQILYYLYYTLNQQESSTFSADLPSYSLSSGLSGSSVSGPRTYEWSKMLSDYNEDYTDEQAAAVAKLLSDVGVSVQMQYAVSVSVTNSRYVSQGCATYFGLQQGSSYTYNSSMGASTWKNAVINELGNYRPVLVASTGHAYVCDGYDGNGLYHFNFGYSGRGDGWYTFDAMNGYGQATWGYTTGLKLRASDSNVTKLSDICKAARAQAALTPVGSQGGQYRSDLYNALMTLVESGEAAVANNCSTMNDTQVTTLCTQISQALEALTMKRSPYPKGTYYVKTFTNYSDGKTKAMYASGTGVNWGTINTSNDNYKWYLEYDEATNAYKMYNVGTNGHFTSISTSTQAKLSTSSTIEVELRPLALVTRENKKVYACTLRPMVSGYNTGFNYYCHQGGHSSGSGTGSTVVGWEPYSDYNQWYLDPIEVEELLAEPDAVLAYSEQTLNIGGTFTNTLTTNSNGAVTYSSSNTNVAVVDSKTGEVTAKEVGTATITVSIAETKEYASKMLTYTIKVVDEALNAEFAQLVEAVGKLYTEEEVAAAKATIAAVDGVTYGDGLITEASQFSSEYTETKEGSFAYLLDGDQSTFWHSKWKNGSVSPGTHYFQVTLNEAIEGELRMMMARRSSATDDHITELKVMASNDPDGTWTEIETLSLPFTSNTEVLYSNFTLPTEYKYLRFYIMDTYMADSSNSSRGYAHMGEFQLYEVFRSTVSDEDLAAAKALVAIDEAEQKAQDTAVPTRAALEELRAAAAAFLGAGDIDGDRKKTIVDIVCLIEILKGNAVDLFGTADMDNNGLIEINDLEDPDKGLVKEVFESK